MSVFYHYTSLAAWHAMQEALGIPAASDERTLRPGKRMISLGTPGPESDHIAYEGAIFGLTEPEPESWWVKEYNLGTPLLQTVLFDIPTGLSDKDQIVLLEVNVESGDKVYVADWGRIWMKIIWGAGILLLRL